METDRDFDIALVEIQAKNLQLIAEYMESKMRPRDLRNLVEEFNANSGYRTQTNIGQQAGGPQAQT